MTTLNPCPFCGGAVAMRYLPDMKLAIVCACGAAMFPEVDAEELARRWNRRPVENAALEALVGKYAQPVEGHYLTAVRNLLIAFVAEARNPAAGAAGVFDALAVIEQRGRALAARLVAQERPQEPTNAEIGPNLPPAV